MEPLGFEERGSLPPDQLRELTAEAEWIGQTALYTEGLLERMTTVMRDQYGLELPPSDLPPPPPLPEADTLWDWVSDRMRDLSMTVWKAKCYLEAGWQKLTGQPLPKPEKPQEGPSALPPPPQAPPNPKDPDRGIRR